MKILLAGTYPDGTADKFRAMLPGHEIAAAETQEQYDAVEDCEIIVVRVLKTPEKTLDNKKQLKAVIRWGAGYDSVDIEAAGKRGILVANTPGVNSYAVAELALGLMISVNRCLDANARQCRGGVWDRNTYSKRSATLNHKTVGIIGGGNIGRRVAKLVQALGAEVVYYDVFRLSEEMERSFTMRYVTLDELLESSDVVSLHVPLLDSTRHIIGKDQLARMKKTAVVVNTARGGLIDDGALAEALSAGKLAGAGLDCVENEDLANNPLKDFDNVVITPHVGGTSNDLAEEMVPAISEVVKKFCATGELEHTVNKEFLA